MKNNTNKKIISILSLLIVTAFTLSPKVYASEITVENIIRLTNQSRLDDGLSILAKNESLSIAAQKKATDMFEKGYFSHDAPDGKRPWYWIEQENYKYRFAGENLAIHFTNAEELHDSWLGSETHRKNILNSSYRDIGVAVVSGSWQGKPTTIVVQFFGTTITEESLVPGGTKELDAKLTSFSGTSPVATVASELSFLKKMEKLREQVLGAMMQALGFSSTEPLLGFFALILGVIFGLNTFAVLLVYIDIRKKKKADAAHSTIMPSSPSVTVA